MRSRFLWALVAVIACMSLAYGGNITNFGRPAGLSETEVTIGEGNELARNPVDFYWRTSLFQVLYYAQEISETPMQINSIKLYNNFTSNEIMDKPLRIWMGNTRVSSLADNWISTVHLTPVFDGMVSFPGGQHTISIPLDNPFQYNATYNLVLMVLRPMDDDHYSMSDKFKAQSDTRLRTRYFTSDSEEINPSNLPAGAYYGSQYPKISLLMELSYDSMVSGVVYNGAGQGLEGALISLNKGAFETTSNQYGYYEFTGMWPGEYQVLVRLEGYHDITDTITLDGVNDLVLDFTMQVNPGSADDQVQPAPVPLLSVTPNPFKQACSLSYEVPKAARVKIAVYNLRGQLIRQLKDEAQSSGSYNISFDGRDLPAGVYLVRAQVGERCFTTRMLRL